MSQILVVLVVLGVACLAVALAFGLAGQTVSVSSYTSGGSVSGSAPGPAAQGAACGFAIAGGLCLLGAAVARRNASSDTVREQAARIEEQVERIRQLRQELGARVENWQGERPPA